MYKQDLTLNNLQGLCCNLLFAYNKEDQYTWVNHTLLLNSELCQPGLLSAPHSSLTH